MKPRISSPNASKEARIAPILTTHLTGEDDVVSKRRIETPRSTLTEDHLNVLVNVIQDVANLSVDGGHDDQDEHSLDDFYCLGSSTSKMEKTTIKSPSSKTAHEKLRSLVPTALKVGGFAKKPDPRCA